MKIQILMFTMLCFLFSACNNSPKPTLAPEKILETPDMHVITSLFNKKAGTMSTLYGNTLALKAAKKETKEHNPGEIFKLITSKLEPNPYWFGGNINGDEQFIETIKVLPDQNGIHVNYEVEKNGADVLREYGFDKKDRINFIFDQKAAVFP